MEDRWYLKKALVDSESDYHNYCHDLLKKIKGKLLIFGCSFESDQHLLDAIKENKNLEEIYVTCINETEVKKVSKKLALDNIKPILIDKNVIWESAIDQVNNQD